MARYFPTIILLILFSMASRVLSQTRCPPGATPGSVQCLPDDPTRNGGGIIVAPKGRWEKTWGALASGDGSSSSMSVSEFLSKREAVEAALDGCREKGGVNCQVRIAYFNQCVAVASTISDEGGSSYASEGTEKKAKNSVIKYCQEDFKKECEVVYSRCTAPVYYEN